MYDAQPIDAYRFLLSPPVREVKTKSGSDHKRKPTLEHRYPSIVLLEVKIRAGYVLGVRSLVCKV